MYSYFHVFKTINGKYYIDLIAFVILVTFLKLSAPFAPCNSQLQGMTVPPSTLLFFAHFCA